MNRFADSTSKQDIFPLNNLGGEEDTMGDRVQRLIHQVESSPVAFVFSPDLYHAVTKTTEKKVPVDVMRDQDPETLSGIPVHVDSGLRCPYIQGVGIAFF